MIADWLSAWPWRLADGQWQKLASDSADLHIFFTGLVHVGSCWFFASEKDPTRARRLKCRNDVGNESHRRPRLACPFFPPPKEGVYRDCRQAWAESWIQNVNLCDACLLQLCLRGEFPQTWDQLDQLDRKWPSPSSVPQSCFMLFHQISR